jgi:hypothetical protein
MGETERLSQSSPAMRALFGSGERWGWELEVPTPAGWSPLRNCPPVPGAGEVYTQKYQEWREQIESQEAASRERALDVALWSPRRPQDDYAMAAMFGGTATGWHALVTTLGGSIIGSRSHLTIVNLSERSVVASLRKLARSWGYRVRMDTVTPQKSSIDLFSYIGHERLVDFIVDVIHHPDEQPSNDALEDRAVLRAVAGSLGEPLTVERLQAALRVVLRESAPPSRGDLIGSDEYQRLSALYGEERRQRTDVVARAAQLESALSDFVKLEQSGRLAPPERSVPQEDLRVIEAWSTPDRLDFDFSVRLLIEAVLRRVMRQAAAPGDDKRVLVIVGADRLKRRLIQSLSDLAEQRSDKLVLLFAHLRDDALDALGSGHAAIGFMRLTDHREASEASKFIGSEHKFVMSQTTRSRSESYEQQQGHNTGRDHGRSDSRGPDFGRTIGESLSVSEGTSTGHSRGETLTATDMDQRVLEEIVEPHILQSLPETGLLFVNLQTRQPVFADCDPTIVTRAS